MLYHELDRTFSALLAVGLGLGGGGGGVSSEPTEPPQPRGLIRHGDKSCCVVFVKIFLRTFDCGL